MSQQICDHQAAMQGIQKQYPFNLLRAVVRERRVDYYLPGLEDAMDTLLPREKECLIMRFASNMTLAAVGEQFGLSAERARQIEAKSLRKLTHPARMRMFRAVPPDKHYDLAEQYRELRGEYNLLVERHNVLQEDYAALTGKPPVVVGTAEQDVLINDAGLSARSYNCLKRAGFGTLGDIAAVNIEELMKVRNLGRKSLDEVLAVLKRHGLKPMQMEDD